ncbi:SAM-dependent methyltransferase [Sphingobacteriaceae bacterium]|nr:SAM-dependent methyltransferase [Sphingobacteriaceae bacterium]
MNEFAEKKKIRNFPVLKTIFKEKHVTEENFSQLLPDYLQKASRLYFTPVHVARMAAQWLTETGEKKILDIGAGIGKFCIVGAKYSDSHFYGIEYRPSLVKLANELIKHYQIENATVLQNNVTEVNFENYDAFYLYNPFYENLVASHRLNSEVLLSGPLYGNYLKYTEYQLDKTKTGTRLVTYHGNNFEIPDSFEKIKESEDSSLKLWLRK